MTFDLRKRFLIEKPSLTKVRKPIWVHCASVGEFNTFKPVLKELRREMGVVLTYFSPRAEDYLRKQKDLYDLLFPLPIDLPFLVRSFERMIDPKALLILEREMWFSLVKFTKTKKILLNAYAKGNILERILVPEYDLIIARTERDKEIFEKEGAKRVTVCGNLKFVQDWEIKEPNIELPQGFKLFVAGSTHRGEEKEIVAAFKKLREEIALKLVIAPRHVSRVREIEEVLKHEGLKYARRSEGRADWDALIIDTLGELKDFYYVADVTFVGGTLIPVGGHNLLEPAYCGKPVLFGPHTEKVKDLEELLLKEGFGFKVNSSDEIVSTVRRILSEGFSPKSDLRDISERVRECYLSVLLSELK